MKIRACRPLRVSAICTWVAGLLFIAAVFHWIGDRSDDSSAFASGTLNSDRSDSVQASVRVGEVWSAAAGVMVANAEFHAALAAANIILLGEVHDNAEHHRRRAQIVRAVVSLQRKTADAAPVAGAVFEHLSADQQQALDAFQAQRNGLNAKERTEVFFEAVAWDKSGWPAAKIFAPLLEAVFATGMEIFAGEPARKTIKAIAKSGRNVVTRDTRRRLGLEAGLGAIHDAASLQEIHEAHCKMMPKSALGNIAYAQRYRDAHLADATLIAAEAHGRAVLFTGNLHVRNDRGVPWYIRQRSVQYKVISVMFIEVENATIDSQFDVPRDPEGNPVADFIVFSPQQVRPDPCLKMREMFKKLKR